MKCAEVRLTEVCKECNVGSKAAECPTARNEGSAVVYYAPPSTIFDLVPYKNHVGEQVICVDDHNQSNIKVGEIHTVVEQTNEQFGYIRLEKFKDYPHMWFSPSCFKKLKATYDNKEYTLSIGTKEPTP